MRRITFWFRFLACLAVASIASAATTLRTVSVVTNSALAIDGVFSMSVVSWEGGDVRGSLVTVPGANGALPTKSVGMASCAPLVVQVVFPPSASLVKWINELCANQSTRRTLQLIDYDAMGVAVGAFEATGVMLTEVTFPAFDASTTAMEPMRLVFNAEQSRVVAPGSVSAGSMAPRTAGSSFSLAIDGLDTKMVMRVEPITVSMSKTADAVGATRDYTKAPASTEFSNLRVIANAATVDTWRTWHTDFVVNGKSGDANEKRGSLGVIQLDGSPSNFALNFGQIGILRVSRRPIARGTVPTVEAEFYFERLDVGSPTATSKAASVAGSPANTSNVSEVSSGAPANSIQQEAPAGSTTPLAGTRTVLADSVPLATTTGAATPSVVAVMNSADQGSRDPAAFPRADGLTRETYSGTFQKTYTSESASYSSKDSIYQLVAKVDAAAKAAGWTMTTLSESSSTSGKTVNQGWTKPSATVSVGYQEAKDGSSTKLNLQVYVQLPATN